MAAKKKPPETVNRRSVTVNQLKDDDPDEALAKTLLRPEVLAALTIQTWEPLYKVDSLGGCPRIPTKI